MNDSNDRIASGHTSIIKADAIPRRAATAREYQAAGVFRNDRKVTGSRRFVILFSIVYTEPSVMLSEVPSVPAPWRAI